MGMYNILKTEVQCAYCKNFFEGNIQFKFGDTWLYEYSIGDAIKWGGLDVGSSSYDKVKVYGLLEEDKCLICGLEIEYEYDIIVEKNIIKCVIPISSMDEYNSTDGNYHVL